ncbi:MAG: CBS domain-containing protein [Propionibacteriaceae bacterium]|jgi:flagellar motility protein MotE (MotC chaperone)|nr:CBS domain-containing protein [Propionibacteriaceae bacterium]
MQTSQSIFVSRLKGLPIFDPNGEQVGRIRDVVVQYRTAGRAPRVKGLVVELFAMRRIFLPMERVHTISPDQVQISGWVNTGRFSRREHEVLVVDDLFDKKVKRKGSDEQATIYDVGIKHTRSTDWEIAEVAIREGAKRFSKGNVVIVDWREITDFTSAIAAHSAEEHVSRLVDMRPADVAQELHDMDPSRRAEVVKMMDNDQLADAMEELPEDEQVALIGTLGTERAADILEEMDPDDAADLIAELTPSMAETILGKMQPEEAEDVRYLLTYDAETAGGLMNSEPVIIPPDATVADALAALRREEVTPSMASVAFVCRPPLDTPTGRYLGGVHIQRLLREPPSILAARAIDSDIQPLHPSLDIAQVSRYFATYDLMCAPVVDENNRLLGAVTVDDVLDHILPTDWRGIQLDEVQEGGDSV